MKNLPSLALTMDQVVQKVGFPADFIHYLIRRDSFPKPFMRGADCYWQTVKVDAWINSYIFKDTDHNK